MHLHARQMTWPEVAVVQKDSSFVKIFTTGDHYINLGLIDEMLLCKLLSLYCRSVTRVKVSFHLSINFSNQLCTIKTDVPQLILGPTTMYFCINDRNIPML